MSETLNKPVELVSAPLGLSGELPISNTEQSRKENPIGKSVLSQLEVTEIADHWDRLDQQKVEDNIYYSRRYSNALLGHLGQKQKVSFVAAWENEELIGLLPVTRKSFWLPYVIPAGAAWITPYTFSCLPILSKNAPMRAAEGLLDSLAQLGISDWCIKDFYLSGPTHSAFCAALNLKKIAWRKVSKYQRAMFEKGPSFEEHVKDFVPSKRRRDLARNRRRLEELGVVTHETHTEGVGLEKAVQAFLDLEKGGWKGERGTAFACRTDTLNFAKEIFRPASGARVRSDLLLLDGTPIAAGMIVFDGDTGFTIKGAYDEAFTSYSVGLLLEMVVAEAFLDGNWAKKLDSATAGSHVIDFLWPERQEVGDLYFSFRPGRDANYLRSFETVDRMKMQLKARIKKLLRR